MMEDQKLRGKSFWKIFEGNDQDWSEQLSNFRDSTYLHDVSWAEHLMYLGWKSCRWECIKGDQKQAYLQSFLKLYPGRIGIVWLPDGIVGDHKYMINLQQDICTSLNLRFCYIKLRSSREYNADDYIQFLVSGWSVPLNSFSRSMTMNLDISDSMENIRSRFSQNWRRTLKKSLKNNFNIIEVRDPKTISKMYKELKKFKMLRSTDIYSEVVIKSIIEAFKENIIILGVKDIEDNVVAIRGAIFRGELATDIFAASNTTGRNLSATHALLVSLLERCKDKGCTSYDLNGIDPENGIGVYLFKKGTGALPKSTLGEFEWTNSSLLRYAISLFSRFR